MRDSSDRPLLLTTGTPEPMASASFATARILAAIGAVLYPAWGALFLWAEPTAIDPLWERLAVGAACGGLGVASLAVPSVAAHMPSITVGLFWLITAHYFSIVVRNDLDPGHAIGAIILTASIAAAFSTRRALALYGVGVTITAVLVAVTVEASRGERAVFAAGVATTMLISYVVLGARLSIARSLGREQARLRATFDALRQGVVVHAQDGRIVGWNAAALDCLGVSEDILLGKTAADGSWGLVDEAGQPLAQADVPSNAAARSGVPILARQLGFRRPDGELRWLRVTAVPIVESPEGIPQVVVAFDDVTEERKIEAQLRLADRLVSVGTLAAGVAHEINNPLTYVLGNLELLEERVREAQEARTLDGDLAGELMQSIDLAHEGGTRVRDIVFDLKTFSRADDTQTSPVDVRKVVESAIRLTRAEVRHSASVVTGSLDVPPVVGSASRLGQVLVNLIINAAHAMPPARPVEKNEIRIDARVEGGRVVVAVRDNGVGIPAAHQARIFDPFFTTKPVGKGTGLGLTVCHGILAALGGSIRAESEEGRGATFIVELPAVAASGPGTPVAEAPRAAAPPAPRPKRSRVLVIDDEVMIGEMIRRQLAKRYDVLVATSAAAALEGIGRGERFDAIVCDVMMPGLSGPDFLRELRVSAPELAARTGFISGGVVTDSVRGLMSDGETRFLAKPFGEAQIAPFVEGLVKAGT